jgi:hypothetical protein
VFDWQLNNTQMAQNNRMTTTNSNPQPNNESESPKRKPGAISEGIYYQSPDRLVSIALKIASAKRYPQHDYPICVLRLIPQKATRVQSLDDHEGGVEYLAPFDEIKKWLEVISLADEKFSFTLSKTAKPKPPERKEYWRQKNQIRFGRPRK